MSEIGSATKDSFEYEGKTYMCLSLSSYDKLEHRMRQDIFDHITETIQLFECSMDTQRLWMQEALKDSKQISVNSVDGLAILNTARYRRYIVELSIYESNDKKLTRDQCLMIADDMRINDIERISEQLLIRDKIFSDWSDPELIIKIQANAIKEMDIQIDLLKQKQEEILQGDHQKKSESSEIKKPTSTVKRKKRKKPGG